MNIILTLTMLGEVNPFHQAALLKILKTTIEQGRLMPGPGDLLLLEAERSVPPVVYHVNRRIIHPDDDHSHWEIVVEEGSAGLFAGREFIQGVVEKMVHDVSKKVLGEKDQIKLITDTIYEATRGKVIYG